jgi:dethiobiotin synthetase
MVPINPDALVIDLIERLALPVVLVARTALGTLNHTLLSLSELRRRSIPVAGVVLNGEEHESNRKAIEAYGWAPVLGRIPRLDTLDATSLRAALDGLRLP